MLTGLIRFAHNHPILFSGVWFGLATSLPSYPIGYTAFLFLIYQTQQGTTLQLMILSAVVAPALLAIPFGMVFGSLIIALRPGEKRLAGLYGLLSGFLTMLVWVFLLEVLPSAISNSTNGGGGDIPGLAEVVGYCVVLPAMVTGVIISSSIAGVLLQKWFNT